MWKNISISNSWVSGREAIFFLALSGNFIITICTLFYSPSWKKIIKGLILAIFGAVVRHSIVISYWALETPETVGKPNNMGKYQKLETERTVLS